MSQTAQARSQRQPTSAPAPVPVQQIDPESPLLDPALLSVVSNLEKTAEVIGRQLNDAALGRLQLSLMKGAAIARLRKAITPGIVAMLMDLMNTKHGFKTDHGPKQKNNPVPYAPEIVIDCAIAALLDGVLWAGNQFNIIAGECYITGEGWEYKLMNLPGFTDLTPFPGTPIVHNGQTCVRFGASWRQDGVKRELKDAKGEPGVVFAVKTDSYSGPDQIVGKARAKCYKLIYKTITSSVQTVSVDEDLGIVGAEMAAEVAAADAAQRITDAQLADLDDAITSYEASALLIRTNYGLAADQRLLAKDFAACMQQIKAGEFSAPAPKDELAEGELPDIEYSGEEVERAVINAGGIPATVFKRFGAKRAADLTQEQRREIVAECEQTVPH